MQVIAMENDNQAEIISLSGKQVLSEHLVDLVRLIVFLNT